jgi:hypothetical protein
LNRYLERIAQGCHESELRIVNHARAAKYRVLEIGRAARTFIQAGQEQLKQSYKKLIELTQGVGPDRPDRAASRRHGAGSALSKQAQLSI